MADKLTRQKIILTLTDCVLSGKINPSSEHVHVLLDSSISGFSVILPDATFTLQREIIFKNIGAKDVTIQAKTGQFIDKGTSHVVKPLDLVSVWPDLVKTWWLLDSNTLGSPVILKDSATPAHYWQLNVSTLGILSTTDLGTTI
jgi:hypothetical protein